MKITYLCQDLGISVDGQKGASSHIRGFVRALNSLGHEVKILTSCPLKTPVPDLNIEVIPLPKFIQGIPKDEDPHLFRALRHVLNNGSVENCLEEIIARDKPDLIYERYSPFGVSGGIIAGQHKIPHILEVNAPLAEQGKKYRKQALQDVSELLEQTAFIHPTILVTLTDELKEWLISLGISPEKILVRPCGIDETIFTPSGPSAKEQFGESTVIGFVGSLKPWHDIEILAESFRELAKDPKYHLLVVGDGPMRKVIQNLSEELPGRVTYTGALKQEEITPYIRAMDICVAPYPNHEIFYFSPLKAFEYMGMGKPVVATGIGQLQTLIREGETGLLVPPENCSELVVAIKKLADNPELRQKMGENGAYEIHQHHTWKMRAKMFMNELEGSGIFKCSV